MNKRQKYQSQTTCARYHTTPHLIHKSYDLLSYHPNLQTSPRYTIFEHNIIQNVSSLYTYVTIIYITFSQSWKIDKATHYFLAIF